MAIVLKDIGNATNSPIYHYTCDTIAQRDSIQIGRIPIHSSCYVINESKKYWLNSNGEWKLQNSQGGDVSGKMDKVPTAVEGNIAEFDDQGQITDSGVAAEDIAVKDGTYPDMTVGKANTAEQLGASHRVEISEPFLLRPTAGTIDVSVDRDKLDENAEIKAIYGKTIVWNQLVQNGNFENSDGWSAYSHSTLTVSENVAKITVGSAAPDGYFYTQLTFPNTLISIENHKYFIAVDVRSSVDTRVRGYFGNVRTFYDSVLSNGIWHHVESIIQAATSHNGGYICGSYTPNQGDTMEFRKFNIVDLTLMFGAGNEPTADEFRTMFPLPYYSYDAGSLLSFSATGLKTVGFNQWDEEWESGSISAQTGEKVIDPNKFRSKNFIPVISGSTYNMSTLTPIASGRALAIVYGYAEDKSFIGELYRPGQTGNLFTIPNNCAFIMFRMGDAYVSYHGANYNHDICINISHSGYRNGEYEPYHTETLPLPISTYFPTGMKSIGTVRDELTGSKATKRIGSRAYQEGDEEDASVITDGTNTLYVLAEPNYTPINPPLDFVYRAEDFGTEEVLLPEGTEPTSTPMYADISYVQNLRDKLDHLPFNPSEPGDYIVHFDGSRQMYAKIGIITPDDLVNYLKEET